MEFIKIENDKRKMVDERIIISRYKAAFPMNVICETRHHKLSLH